MNEHSLRMFRRHDMPRLVKHPQFRLFQATREAHSNISECEGQTATTAGLSYCGRTLAIEDASSWKDKVNSAMDRKMWRVVVGNTLHATDSLLEAEAILFRFALGNGYLDKHRNVTLPAVDALACEFACVVREWTDGPDVWRMIDTLNRDDPDASTCHSHDFIDANMAMLEAFKRFDVPEDLVVGGVCHNDAGSISALWEKAWYKAKHVGFYCEDEARNHEQAMASRMPPE